jgi:hypothetical protein
LLQAGDCVLGSDLRLDNTSVAMPTTTQVVSCDEPHDGEVFLAADPWAASAKFPGDDSANELTDGRCTEAFRAYVGVDYRNSMLDYTPAAPSTDSWASGDRHILCIAFDPKGKLVGTVRRAGR